MFGLGVTAFVVFLLAALLVAALVVWLMSRSTGGQKRD